MKKYILTAAAFFAFTALASAQVQEEQDRLEQQPVPVTQKQVERQAKQAETTTIDENEKAELLKKQQKKDMRKNKQDAATAAPATSGNTTTKKTSTKPGKQ